MLYINEFVPSAGGGGREISSYIINKFQIPNLYIYLLGCIILCISIQTNDQGYSEKFEKQQWLIFEN